MSYQYCVKMREDKIYVLEEFKEHIVHKYGYLRGFQGRELVRAIEIYNLIQRLTIYDDPEFLKSILIAGVRAIGADTEF